MTNNITDNKKSLPEAILLLIAALTTIVNLFLFIYIPGYFIVKNYDEVGKLVPAVIAEVELQDTKIFVDSIIERLENADIIFNTPQRMDLNNNANINLVLGSSLSNAELTQAINDDYGSAENASIKMSNLMEAHLASSSFQIYPITPERQAITLKDATQWQWTIKPVEPGIKQLYLAVSILFNLNGREAKRVIYTVERSVIIYTKFLDRLILFLKNNWQWLWMALLGPLVGLLWTALITKKWLKSL